MMASPSVFPGGFERFATKVYLLWAGLAIGVAFLATPAKFLAPSLSLTVALEVGRHTFRVYNGVELALVLGLLVLGAASRQRRRWYFGLGAPTVQPFMYIVGSDRSLAACLDAGARFFYLLAEPVFRWLQFVWNLADFTASNG